MARVLFRLMTKDGSGFLFPPLIFSLRKAAFPLFFSLDRALADIAHVNVGSRIPS